MRSGTRLVLVFFLLAAAAFVLFRLYGDRIVAERAVQTPLGAARLLAESDNTVVGHLGGVRDVALVEMRSLAPGDSVVGLAVEVIGARGGGMLYADLERAGSRWRVLRARFIAPGGERLPLAGAEPPALAPAD